MKFTNDPTLIEHYRNMASTMMYGIVEMVKHNDGTFNVLFVNETAGKLLCNNSSEATAKLDKDPFSFVYPADVDRVKDAIAACDTKENVSETYRAVSESGDILWVLARFHSVVYENELHVVISYININDIMGAQAKLQSEGDRLLDIVNSIPTGIAIMEIEDDGRSNVLSLNDQMVSFANQIGEYLDGNARHWSKEELTLLFNQSIYAFCANSDVHLVKGMLDDSKNNEVSYCVFLLRGSTAEKPVYVRSTCHSKPVSDTARNYYITFENVTKDKLQELELANKQEMLMKMSYYDALTEVKNRHSYNNFVKECRTNPLSNVGLLFADLNGLKRVNDELGHQYGDGMLVHFSQLLKKHFSPDITYRISGDEFVVVLPKISRADFTAMVEELLHEIEDSDNMASVGFVWEEKLSDVKMLAGKAEQIMYVEKQRFYEHEKNLKSKHRPILLNTLLSDLENKRFQMYLQPKASVDSSAIIGAEALVRKVDAAGKIIPPYEFIPQLEKERLIPQIDFYMLDQVCQFLEVLKKENKTNFKISVNMSRVTLVENNYLQTIENIINRYDFNINQLEFEITESNETMDNQRLEDYIAKIKERGISISLDDVGTDYSSLPMLLLDGIDTVKLDRSLITKIQTPKANKLLRHVTNMCHDLGIEVIAEGIETNDDLDSLKLIECDSFQGYLLSKPIPAADFKERYFA